jgi:hypothetical protein
MQNSCFISRDNVIKKIVTFTSIARASLEERERCVCVREREREKEVPARKEEAFYHPFAPSPPGGAGGGWGALTGPPGPPRPGG